ncbi:DddA-like double-stranded DNA deaminase toxin [Actinokineospora sp. G85]|uniref:DddA-like double-stranded DNA deaminase toxin n=1 Tax=Actinokineospora sp. G85 TaxID=3406626 RepID=UPI003C71A32B
MRDAGIKEASVVINNRVCTGPFSCDRLISVILPAGYILTVYGPKDYKRVYLGGERL